MGDLFIFGIRSQRTPLLENLFPQTKKLKNEQDADIMKSISEELIFSLSREQDSSSGSSLPLNFPSIEEEIGFTFLMEALRFGSCFDRILEASTRGKKSARETIQFGLLGMFISNKPPHQADILIEFANPHAISTSFDFPIHESKALEFAKMGGVYQDVDGPLLPFANLICKAMNEMGVLLRARRMNHLGELVLQVFTQSDHSVKKFSSLLSQSLPLTFGDVSKEIEFLCKAQRTASILERKFPERFKFNDCENISPLVDSELVFSLRKLGVLKIPKEIEKKVDSEEHNFLLYGSTEEFTLRSLALQCVRELTKGRCRNDLASDWINAKATQYVHSTMRQHLCQTLYY